MKRIGILTSSRADYGIYKPLLSALHNASDFAITRIVFGSHLLDEMDSSLQEIKDDVYGEYSIVGTFKKTNLPRQVAETYGNVVLSFSKFWENTSFDLVFSLGDRFEMAAAVQAAIPFGIKMAHIHGGEITLGAIDNIFRDQISIASLYHFTAIPSYTERLQGLLMNSDHVYTVGALSLSNMPITPSSEWDEIRKSYALPNKEFILITIHPETSSIEENQSNVEQLSKLLLRLSKEYHLLITGTNTDQDYLPYSYLFKRLKNDHPDKITLISTMGRKNYFAAIQHCKFMLGNSSSGIIESASFGKYNIDLGNRQRGRLKSENTVNLPFSMEQVLKQIDLWSKEGFVFSGENIYQQENTPEKIVEVTRNLLQCNNI